VNRPQMRALFTGRMIGPLAAEFAAGLLAVALALGLVAGFIAVIGSNPLQAYQALLKGSLGSTNGIAETLVRTTPLLLAGLGVTIAFRCGIWNIGAEGQIYMGALGATAVGLYAPPLPIGIHLPLVIVAGFVAGGLWGALPGFFKARWNVNEIITTIMMNYLAINLVSYMVAKPMKDPSRMIPVPQTAELARSAWLPILIPTTRAHAGIFLAAAMAIVVYFLLWKTTLGYEIKAVGANPIAARHGGISVGRSIVLAMFLSGGLAGLAGASEISGVLHYLLDGFSPGYGNLAIAVALFGGLHPLGVTFSALFFGALMVGSDAMQRAVGVPSTTVFFIQGLVIIFVLARKVLVGQRQVVVDVAPDVMSATAEEAARPGRC
jgi:ABC-type uncharacterized transport system permease subunit